MADLLNTDKCYYSRGNTDCSEWQAGQVNQQLDYCENCDRYSQCHDVAVLNDRLVELENNNSTAICKWCKEEYDMSDLKQTTYGLLCDKCIRAIKSRGEEILVSEV